MWWVEVPQGPVPENRCIMCGYGGIGSTIRVLQASGGRKGCGNDIL